MKPPGSARNRRSNPARASPHDPHCGRADDDTVTIYGDPAERLQREVLRRTDNNGHFSSWQPRGRYGRMPMPGNASPRNEDRQHPPRPTRSTQNLRIRMAASGPELNLAAAR